MIFMDSYTSLSAFVLLLTFIIVVTRFRLWHTSNLLNKIFELASNPVNNMINQTVGIFLTYHNEINQLYLIWVAILLIAYDNVFTISYYSLLEGAAERRSREYGFLYNCILTGVFLNINKSGSEFYSSLLALWSLVHAKFAIRFVSYMHADRAYGLENVKQVAEYMKNEHKLTEPRDAIDPTIMKGCEYLVMGEVIESVIEAPKYSPEFKLRDDVVTVERVWSCKEGLLHPSVDGDGDLKDVCLSFVLFKLLRRRMFGYPAGQAGETKTRQLIFGGLIIYIFYTIPSYNISFSNNISF